MMCQVKRACGSRLGEIGNGVKRAVIRIITIIIVSIIIITIIIVIGIIIRIRTCRIAAFRPLPRHRTTRSGGHYML